MKYQIDRKTYIIDENDCMESDPCYHDVAIIDVDGKETDRIIKKL